MSLALQEANNTLPEDHSWYQGKSASVPDIGVVESGLAFRINRNLNTRTVRSNTASSEEQKDQTHTNDNTRLRAERVENSVRTSLPIRAVAPSLSLQPLQEWEGYVIEIGPQKFSARLTDRTAQNETEDEVAEFPITDLSDDDLKLLTPGAVFRWVIGYQRARGGTKRRVSQVTFRRMPAWSRKELKAARAEANELMNAIIWD